MVSFTTTYVSQAYTQKRRFLHFCQKDCCLNTHSLKFIFRGRKLLKSRSPNQRGIQSVQFSSVTQLRPTLCNPMNCSTPGLPVHHQLLEFTQTHAHRVGDAIQPSHPLLSPSPPAPKSLPASGSFPMSQPFTWGGHSIGVSASASVCPMNTQDWY